MEAVFGQRARRLDPSRFRRAAAKQRDPKTAARRPGDSALAWQSAGQKAVARLRATLAFLVNAFAATVYNTPTICMSPQVANTSLETRGRIGDVCESLLCPLRASSPLATSVCSHPYTCEFSDDHLFMAP
ncbi:unnamed protein product [Prorocentrum cordatum]|uniref:Uncharacterized protein n=1 Tax=Prorocentrum cordatum TaxID=2364126 RepID=A0ABN9PUH6_9DINO|nr:unnamed protein product [Polarella glacialis]